MIADARGWIDDVDRGYDDAVDAASSELSPKFDPPIGYIESPAAGEPAEADNAIRLEGWALDAESVVEITLERKPRPGDGLAHLNSRGLVSIGDSVRCHGVRPDVGRAFPGHPHTARAGWSVELRREMVSRNDSFRVTVHVLAHNARGQTTDLGSREIAFVAPGAGAPFLFCSKPFDSVLIDPNGDVNPYPDCQPSVLFGSLAEPGATLEAIWFGPAFTDLRRRIVDRDPPQMCLGCPNFVNRNVDDPDYFAAR